MRTIIVRDNMRIPLGKQGENNAVRVVWPKIAEKYAKLYGDGRFELVVVQKGKAYPAVVSVDGTDLVWDVLAADVATAGVGSLELIYYVGDTVAKSQTWETMVIASKSADGMTEPPEDPARAWFDAIKRQIGDLNKLTTKAKDNLVAAINEAARTGSGGGGTVEMRVDGGYIQYSTDGVTWENLIAVAALEGKPGKDGEPGAPGKDGEPGKNGEPGKDGHTPKIAATKTGKTTSITADGVEIAQVKDGEDAAPDISLGLTAASIGQTIKVKAVDTDGKPTAWEAVDMAGDETWELIRDITLEEDVSSVKEQNLALTKIYITVEAHGTSQNQDPVKNGEFRINGQTYFYSGTLGLSDGQTRWTQSFVEIIKDTKRHISSSNNNNSYQSNSMSAGFFGDGSQINELEIVPFTVSGKYIGANTRIKIYGVRA